jgi:hypothetical protein
MVAGRELVDDAALEQATAPATVPSVVTSTTAAARDA